VNRSLIVCPVLSLAFLFYFARVGPPTVLLMLIYERLSVHVVAGFRGRVLLFVSLLIFMWVL
jgi:hypothetical protein